MRNSRPNVAACRQTAAVHHWPSLRWFADTPLRSSSALVRAAATEFLNRSTPSCQLTGQKLRLDDARERAWSELWHQGFTLEAVRRVIVCPQREIREDRRNVGALKLSNRLPPHRFEEARNIRRVRLAAPTRPAPGPPAAGLSPAEQERGCLWALEHLRQLNRSLQ